MLSGLVPFIVGTHNLPFNFQLLKYKTRASFLRIVNVGATVALALLARYNVQM
jgi:hypothetical protein